MNVASAKLIYGEATPRRVQGIRGFFAVAATGSMTMMVAVLRQDVNATGQYLGRAGMSEQTARKWWNTNELQFEGNLTGDYDVPAACAAFAERETAELQAQVRELTTLLIDFRENYEFGDDVDAKIDAALARKETP